MPRSTPGTVPKSPISFTSCKQYTCCADMSTPFLYRLADKPHERNPGSFSTAPLIRTTKQTQHLMQMHLVKS